MIFSERLTRCQQLWVLFLIYWKLCISVHKQTTAAAGCPGDLQPCNPLHWFHQGTGCFNGESFLAGESHVVTLTALCCSSRGGALSIVTAYHVFPFLLGLLAGLQHKMCFKIPSATEQTSIFLRYGNCS